MLHKSQLITLISGEKIMKYFMSLAIIKPHCHGPQKFGIV